MWVSTILHLDSVDLFLLFLSSWGNNSLFLCTLQIFRLKNPVHFLFWPALSWVPLRYLWQSCPAWVPPGCSCLNCLGTWVGRVRGGSLGPHTPPPSALDDWGDQWWMYRARVMNLETPEKKPCVRGLYDPIWIQLALLLPCFGLCWRVTCPFGLDLALFCQALPRIELVTLGTSWE